MTFPEVTDHAIDRYVERVKPGYSDEQARDEILRLLWECQATEGRPEWIASRFPAARWLVVGDIAFPIARDGRGERILTCLVKGMLGERAAKRRHRRRVHRRRHRTSQHVGNRRFEGVLYD